MVYPCPAHRHADFPAYLFNVVSHYSQLRPKGGGLFEIQNPPAPARPPKVFAPGWGSIFEQAAPLVSAS